MYLQQIPDVFRLILGKIVIAKLMMIANLSKNAAGLDVDGAREDISVYMEQKCRQHDFHLRGQLGQGQRLMGIK